MKLVCLGSSSSGNGYILIDADGRALAIEAGAKAPEYFREVMPSKYSGVLISHEHKDHAVNALHLAARYGIKPIASLGTLEALGIPKYLTFPLFHSAVVGGWRITPVRVRHDAVEPCAFVIERSGQKILFATDLAEFPDIPHELLDGLTVLMIEANYDAEIAIRSGKDKAYLDRLSDTHLSIVQAESTVKRLANGYSIETVVLLHLSDGNSHAEDFKRRIQDVAPAARVYVADKGLTIENLNLW